MNNLKTLLLILAISSLVTVASEAANNPFSCKIHQQKQQKSKKSRTLKKISYKGYAFLKQQQFAIVQIGKKQYTVKLLDRIMGIQVIEILPESLTYSQNQRIYKVEIESPYSEFSNQSSF